ncbi:ABC transporter permease [soil metagenome]
MNFDIVALVLGIAVPIVLAAVGGSFSAQVNVFNVGLEGMMLAGAFFGFWASHVSGNVVLGFAAGALAGMLAALVLSLIINTLGGDEIVAGIAFNLAMLGLTATLLSTIFGTQGSALSREAGTVGTFGEVLAGIPLVGSMLSRLDVVIVFMIALVVAASLFSARTSHGLRLRAVGSSLEAARAAGISIARYKYLAFAIGGVLCGIGGAYLPLASLSIYTNNMTAGLGFIALAAVIMSGGRPLIAALAALLFAIASAVGIQLQSSGLPNEIVLAVPYLAAIAAVVWRAVTQRKRLGTLSRTGREERASG